MPLRVPDPVVRDPVDVRRLDRPAVAAHGRKAHVVQHYEHHVRRAIGGLRRLERSPVRGRIPDVDIDSSLEGLAHPAPLPPGSVRWPTPEMLAKVHSAAHHPPGVSPGPSPPGPAARCTPSSWAARSSWLRCSGSPSPSLFFEWGNAHLNLIGHDA